MKKVLLLALIALGVAQSARAEATHTVPQATQQAVATVGGACTEGTVASSGDDRGLLFCLKGVWMFAPSGEDASMQAINEAKAREYAKRQIEVEKTLERSRMLFGVSALLFVVSIGLLLVSIARLRRAAALPGATKS